MASWRCPHCGSAQQEAARCWVCRRSSTTCDTCRHFRKGVAVRLGYCALDKAHTPLTGEEERACWEKSPSEKFVEPEIAAAEPVAGSSGTSLWGIPTFTDVAPDRPAPSHGLWSDIEPARDPEPARNEHTGSVRARPWGDVPGGGKDAAYLRGLKVRQGSR